MIRNLVVIIATVLFAVGFGVMSGIEAMNAFLWGTAWGGFAMIVVSALDDARKDAR